MENQAQDRLPVLKARRTLLIGIGTSGARICDQLLERVFWAYESAGNVPWVKCIVLETAGIADEQEQLKTSAAQVITLGIDSSSYGSLINHPQNYEAQMGFSTWNIPEATSTGDAFTDSIKVGANNKRILGRLALLYPNNFNKVHTALTTALSQLQALTEQEASVDYAKSGEKVQLELSSQVNVYVAGTLCGGTSSGAFIDFGFLLRSLSGYTNLTTNGLFLLPSAAHTNAKHTANAYAALLELNHFSSDQSRYVQKFPTIGEVRKTPGTRPYDHLYLLQAKTANGVDYAKLVTATADYIASDVIGGTADKRDATRTNIADYFGQRDAWGATQKFFTLGIGSIEFPYTKVVKACSVRLLKHGFDQLLNAPEPPLTELQAMVSSIKLLEAQAMRDRLLRRVETNSTVSQDIEKALNAAKNTSHPANLESNQAQIEVVFNEGASSKSLEGLPSNLIRTTLDRNLRAVEQELQTAIREKIQVFLTPPQMRGLPGLLGFLKALEARLLTEIDESKKPKVEEAYDAKAREAQNMATTCYRDFFLKVTFANKAATERYIKECISHRINYYRTRCAAACAEDRAKLLTESLKFVRTVLGRVENPNCGLQREAKTLQQGLSTLYGTLDAKDGAATDGSRRVINGYELFTPGSTIEEEYKNSLRDYAGQRSGDLAQWEREFALQALQSDYLPDAMQSLYGDANTVTRFDPEGRTSIEEPRERELVERAKTARFAFAKMKNRTLIQRLLSQKSELPKRLDDANRASQLFLNWDEGHSRYRAAENKAFKYIFFKDDDPQAAEFRSFINEAGLQEGQGGISFINDPHQMMIVREQGAFSLGTVRELMDEVPMQKWRDDFLRQTTKLSHSRGDVPEWISWAKADEETRIRDRNLFLVAVALDILEFESARLYVFKYPPKSPTDTGRAELSNDLDRAMITIKNLKLAPDIEQRILKHRGENGGVDLHRRLVDFIKGSENRFTQGDRPLSSRKIEQYLLDYIQADTELLALYRATFPDQAELKYLFVENGKPTYRCSFCEKTLGLHASDLYQTEERNGEQTIKMECAYCKHSLD